MLDYSGIQQEGGLWPKHLQFHFFQWEQQELPPLCPCLWSGSAVAMLVSVYTPRLCESIELLRR